MYCPQCLTEYRDGFFECADCRVPLAPGPPPEGVDEPQPVFGGAGRPPYNGELELVTVLETEDPFALALAQAALEEVGIEYLVVAGSDKEVPDAVRLDPQARHHHPYRVQVTVECRGKARELLEPLEQPLSATEMDAPAEGTTED